MEQNKIYQACREDAKEILRNEARKANQKLIIFNEEQLNQLTAELYAQKFADWIQPMDIDKDFYSVSVSNQEWEWKKTIAENFKHEFIGTTAQLHEKFVEENKGWENA